jgi:hypothetical protein
VARWVRPKPRRYHVQHAPIARTPWEPRGPRGEAGAEEHLGIDLNDELSQLDLWISPDESVILPAITDHPAEGSGSSMTGERCHEL